MVETKDFYDDLKKKGMDFFAGVPDSLLKNFCACVQENSDAEHHIITANEGNAIAIAAGHYLATKKIGVVYMQNSGIGNAVNPLVSLVDEKVYQIPILLIVGWRGEPGVKDEPQHKKQGEITLELFQTMGIKTIVLTEHYQTELEEAYQYMQTTSLPVACIVKKNYFTPYAFTKEKSDSTLTREEALQVVMEQLHEDEFIVSTTGKTSREIFEIREQRGEDHAHDFLTVGSMGHTASIAFGLALGTDRTIYCVDGDGSFLMHMGGLAIIAKNAPSNFKYILINNGAHESVGGQPTVVSKIDVPKVLSGFGMRSVVTASTKEEILSAFSNKQTLQVLIINVKQGSRENLGRPTGSPIENKMAFMEQLSQ